MRSPRALVKAAWATAANLFRGQLLTRLWPAGGSLQERGLRQQIATYQNNPWMRANLGKIARSYAQVRWYVCKPEKGDGRALIDESRSKLSADELDRLADIHQIAFKLLLEMCVEHRKLLKLETIRPGATGS